MCNHPQNAIILLRVTRVAVHSPWWLLVACWCSPFYWLVVVIFDVARRWWWVCTCDCKGVENYLNILAHCKCKSSLLLAFIAVDWVIIFIHEIWNTLSVIYLKRLWCKAVRQQRTGLRESNYLQTDSWISKRSKDDHLDPINPLALNSVHCFRIKRIFPSN